MGNLVLVRFHPKEGSGPSVEQILRGMVAKTRLEPGCECYDLFHSTTDGRRIYVLLEKYRDAAALDAHRASEHYKAYRGSIMEHLAAPIDVSILEGLDVRAV
jgi:quinol monooxygenase YgiN